MRAFASSLALAGFATLCAMSAAGAQPAFTPQAPIHNIVLVHGAFADGSGWRPVAEILQHDGYHVSVVQEPETSLADDVAATRAVLARQDGPSVLVEHSYGGAVITEAGNAPNVASLVYVAAFMPDAGETIGALIGRDPGAAHSIGPVGNGYLAIDPVQFHADFAADVPKATADFMSISQVPVQASAMGTPIAAPAWREKPVYAIVATQDRMINPDLEIFMDNRAHARTAEITSSHAVYISHPRAVAAMIEKAAGRD